MVVACAATPFLASCTSDGDDGEAATTTVVAAPDESLPFDPASLPGCWATGSVRGDIEATFDRVRATRDRAGADDDPDAPAYYVVEQGSVTAVFRSGVDGQPMVMVRDGDRQLTAIGVPGVAVDPTGTGASAASVTVAATTGEADSAVIDVEITCR